VEFTANYTTGGFLTYANVAYSVAQGKGASSAQFLWGNQNVVNYVNNNWIYLDHDQRVTGSFAHPIRGRNRIITARGCMPTPSTAAG